MDPAAADRLLAWMEEVRAANRRMSLTSITEEDAFVRDHILDSLAALAVLPAAGVVIDVGTGAGFPGVPLAIVRPALRVTLLEANQKKAAFLARSGLAVVCARAEDHARGPGRDAYDVAVTRAMAPFAVAAELVLPLVRPGGQAVLWLGREAAGEAGEAARVCAALGALPERVVPSESPGRRLRVLRKVAPTPDRFPRRAGVATRRPL